jgi:hypothetical protein
VACPAGVLGDGRGGLAGFSSRRPGRRCAVARLGKSRANVFATDIATRRTRASACKLKLRAVGFAVCPYELDPYGAQYACAVCDICLHTRVTYRISE